MTRVLDISMTIPHDKVFTTWILLHQHQVMLTFFPDQPRLFLPLNAVISIYIVNKVLEANYAKYLNKTTCKNLEDGKNFF